MLKDKNILYIVHNYTSFQKDQIEEASKHFNRVYVLVRYKVITIIANFTKLKFLQKYSEENCIDLHDLPSNVEVFKTPVFYFPFDPFYKILGERHFKKALKVIQKNNLRFDIIHSHFIWSSGYVGMKLSEIFNVPFLVTGHGYDVYSLPFKSEWWKKTIKEVLEKATRIITVSKSNAGSIEKLITGKEISVIPNGFSPGLFYTMDKKKVREELGLNVGGKTCLSIGNLIKIKGQEYLIKAMESLSKEFDDLNLYIIGAGPLQSNLQKYAKELGLEKRINFIGLKPHNEIVKWLNAADLLVISSLGEGAPVVLMEALSCGIPVVGTKVGNVEEVLKSEEYGFVCDSKDAQGLAKAISKSLSKSWNRDLIAEYGEQFTWAKANEKIVQIYSKLLETNQE